METVPVTRAQWVDAQLRRAILHGEFAPGERLRVEHLAERFGVSPTPLRETFMRLAGEGLVVLEPQRGARVAPLDVEEATEVYELRLLLDPEALHRSIAAAIAADALTDYAGEVEAAHKVLSGRHVSIAAYHDAHRDFHLRLISRCPNRRLIAQVAQLMDHSQRFHAVGVATTRRSDPAAEHRAIATAAAGGHVAQAVSLLRAHLEATLAAVRSPG
jgi:GntR family carbon starvation induced transcriptional regulator